MVKTRLYTIHVEHEGQISTYKTVNTFSANNAVWMVYNQVSRMYKSGIVWANVKGFRKNNSAMSF